MGGKMPPRQPARCRRYGQLWPGFHCCHSSVAAPSDSGRIQGMRLYHSGIGLLRPFGAWMIWLDRVPCALPSGCANPTRHCRAQPTWTPDWTLRAPAGRQGYDFSSGAGWRRTLLTGDRAEEIHRAIEGQPLPRETSCGLDEHERGTRPPLLRRPRPRTLHPHPRLHHAGKIATAAPPYRGTVPGFPESWSVVITVKETTPGSRRGQ